MKVKDIMSKHVLTLDPEVGFQKLWEIIFKKRVNSIPIVDKKAGLVGIVTRDDVMKYLYPDYQEYIESLLTETDFEGMEEKIHDLSSMKAKDFMSRRVIFARPDTPVMRALSRMLARRVDQLPVLTEDNQVVGLVTKGDVFYALFKKHLTGHEKPRFRKTR